MGGGKKVIHMAGEMDTAETAIIVPMVEITALGGITRISLITRMLAVMIKIRAITMEEARLPPLT